LIFRPALLLQIPMLAAARLTLPKKDYDKVNNKDDLTGN
jgi:hypothetical protein